MLSSKTLHRLIILSFMGLVGFSLAKSIDAGSVMGLILAVTSLGAGVYFVYLLQQMSRDVENNNG